MDVVFQIYANGEISCVGGMAFVLSAIIIHQIFPVLIIVKEASNLTTLQFYCWFQISFLQTYLAGWVTVQQDSEGKWIKARGLKTWRLQKTLEGIVAELQPPTRDTLYPLLGTGPVALCHLRRPHLIPPGPLGVPQALPRIETH